MVSEIALLIGYEATRDLKLYETEIKTPMCNTIGQFFTKQVCFVPILRAGLGMVDALLNLLPAAKVGHVGLYRDPETHLSVEYYSKMPTDIAERVAIILDPMLGTGGSAVACIDLLKNKGCKQIKMINIIGAPEGVKAVQEAHHDVNIYLGSLDKSLNEHCYILPGLGDAGDRLFGTF